MIQIIFVSAISLYSLLVKDCRKIILLIIAILPFNSILKAFCLHNGGDGIFSFWKEIAILILFIRTYTSISRIHISYNSLLKIYVFIIMYFSIFFIIGTEIYGASMAFRTFRNIVFLPILLFIYPNLDMDKTFINRFFYVTIISATLMGLTGIIECHFGYREFIRGYMGQIEEIGRDGTIYYKTSNLKIMGFERMSGLMGTPNQFGNYMALSASFTYFCLKRKLIEYKHYILLWGVFILIILCLIESFCRTAFAMFLLILIITEYKSKKNIVKNIIIISTISIFLLYIATFINDTVSEIFSATFSGEEASSADRGNNFKKGIDFLFANPFGYGLGSTENSLKNYIYFSESAFLNLGIEAGVIAIILFLCFCKKINNVLLKCQNKLSIFSSSVIITNSICFLFANIFSTPYIYLFWFFTGIGLMRKLKENTSS